MEQEILKQILKEIKENNQKITNLETEFREFKSEIQELKSEMQEFKEDMQEFKLEMQEFKEDMQEFKEEMQIFKDDTNRSLARVENDHGKKLSVLLDGYTMLYELTAEVRKDISILKGRQEIHDIKIRLMEIDKIAQ